MKHIFITMVISLTALLLAGVFIATPQAQANAPITVNSTVDEVDATPGNGICASTPSGQCTLRAAIMEANALAGPDVINVPAGVYTLTIAGADENAGATGDLDVYSDMTITGAGSDSTVIDGNYIDRIFDVFGGKLTVSISNVTVQRGINSVQSVGFGGGGIRQQTAGALTLLNSTVSNSISWDGAGIYNYAGTLNIAGSIVVSNISSNGSGGILNFGAMTITQSTITQNSDGIINEGILAIDHSAIISNSGTGIWNMPQYLAPALSAVLTVTKSAISSNNSNNHGCVGGILNQSVAFVFSSTIANNQTNCPYGWIGGGGIDNAGGIIEVVNSTISGNSAVSNGGGIFNSNYGVVRLRNATLAYNIADSDGNGQGSGGGVYNTAGQGQVFSTNTIVGENVDASGVAPDFSGLLNSQGYNLIGSSLGYTAVGVVTGNLVGQNPLLSPLQDNGGPTFTHALLPGSPAIDAGDLAGCTDASGNPLTTDQRGHSRPVGLRCDIGAYEARLERFFLPFILR